VRARTGLGNQLDILASGERLLQARQIQADLDAEGSPAAPSCLSRSAATSIPKTHVKLAAAADRGANTEGRP